jgi:hypothetical protein
VHPSNWRQDIPAKIFWVKFQFFWSGPVAVAGRCFALVYARLNRFLSRCNFLLLFMFLLLGSLLILTNDIHHWIWTGFSYSDGVLYQLRGCEYWILRAIGYLLALLNLPVLIWLFIRSPQHRWPAAFILCGQMVVRAALVLDEANINLVAPLHLVILAATFLSVMYARTGPGKTWSSSIMRRGIFWKSWPGGLLNLLTR